MITQNTRGMDISTAGHFSLSLTRSALHRAYLIRSPPSQQGSTPLKPVHAPVSHPKRHCGRLLPQHQ
uniref:Transcription factor n=1 Tax=Phragmites mauritianus TaxID=1073913 RepID=X2F0Z4_9POAL|nr:transcription factor [Phragmites mauritianus]